MALDHRGESLSFDCFFPFFPLLPLLLLLPPLFFSFAPVTMAEMENGQHISAGWGPLDSPI